jgi:hypothetical protein
LEFALGLKWHEPKNGVQVLTVGNCRIVLSRQTETRTEFANDIFRPVKSEAGAWTIAYDAEAKNALTVLREQLTRNRLLEHCPDKARIANETLKRIKSSPLQSAVPPGKTREQMYAGWQAELAKLANKTDDEAAAEYYAAMQAQATDAPKMTKWTRDQKLTLIGIIIAAITLIVAIWAVLIQLGIIQNPINAATPTLTPTLVSPTSAP